MHRRPNATVFMKVSTKSLPDKKGSDSAAAEGFSSTIIMLNGETMSRLKN